MSAAVKYTPRGALSARDLEILAMVAEGMTNLEIGQRLFIGEVAIKVCLSGINQKLGSRNRTEMVGTAYREGILSVPQRDRQRSGWVDRVLAEFRPARSIAPAGSRFASLFDAVAVALDREAMEAE